MMKLEEKLAQLRKEKGLSQAYVAEAMEVSRQAISRWEVGTALPSTENLCKLAKLYGVSIDVLMNDCLSLSQIPKEPVATPMTETAETSVDNGSIKNHTVKTRRYLAISTVLVVLGILVGYLLGQHRGQEVRNTEIPIEKLETEQWDDYGVDSYTYGWPDFGEGGEEK